MGKHQFIHTMSTVYYCIPCIKAFKCKKNLTEKEKKKREEEYKKTKKLSVCPRGVEPPILRSAI